MLSPASLRVCCLAVMAPALTKAVRQADCLPVVISKSYCVSETTNSFNCQSDSAVSNDVIPGVPANLHSRKLSMPNDRAWCQQPLGCRVLLKTDSPASGPTKPSILIFSGKNRANAELKAKLWHSAKVVTAISEKFRSKNTMNKNNSPSLKNMGLAKANTSLGFQSPKKIQRIMPLSHVSNVTSETQRILQLPEKPLEVPDSTKISDMYISASSLVLPSTLDGPVSTPSMLDGIGIMSSSTTVGVSPMDTSACLDAALPSTSKSVVAFPDVLKCVSDTSTTVSTVTASSSIVQNVNSLFPFSKDVTKAPLSKDSVTLPTSKDSVATIPKTSQGTIIPSLPGSSKNFAADFSSANGIIAAFPAKCKGVRSASSLKSNSEFLVFPSTSKGTIVASPSALMSRRILMKFPKKSTNIVEALASTSKGELTILPSKLKTHTSISHRPRISPSKFQAMKDQQAQLEKQMKDVLAQLLQMQSKYLNAHVTNQLSGLVEHLQNKLSIPCQRQIQPNSCRRGKDPVDIKAELLQSEDVRNLSTAALVNLVRKLESSPGKYLPQQKSVSISGEQCSTEKVVVRIDSDECDEIKRTNGMLLADVRNLLSSADPDLTESSSGEESCDETETSPDDEEQSTLPLHKRALWKWVNDRASIASRWTWLISQVHDLEYQLRRLGEVLKQARNAKGGVCFEELVVPSESSALSTPIADNASLQTTSTKQAALKSIIKPVNGYLDHGPTSVASDSCHVVQTASPSSAAHCQQDSGRDGTTAVTETCFCSRTRPLKTATFRKRKLLRTAGLHLTNTKASRLSTLGCSCSCQSMMLPCALCSGRYNNVQSIDPDLMPLLERIALLDPCFHPVLSFEKDVPLHLHFENILKKKEAYYQSLNVQPPVTKKPRLGAKPKHFSDVRNHNRKLKRYAGSLLSAKYRNKHVRNTKHLRKRGLFLKWRRLQNKSSINRVRRLSIASSGSSRDSPVPSLSSILDDGYGYDNSRRRREDHQFDIDNVIIPCNSKSGRLEKLQYKEIEIPSWRYMDIDASDPAEDEEDEEEDISDAVFSKRYDKLEVEERKLLRGSALGFSGTSRRGRRQHRCDSRADSSGANTPDPVLLYQQDIVFQDPNSIITGGPTSPALSPPATPGSVAAMSDDSQPSLGNGLTSRSERKRAMIPFKRDRPYDDNIRMPSFEYVYIPPYEPRVYPLSDREYEEMLKESTHFNDEPDLTPNGLNCPASPASSSSSTSTVDEDDITDPEWTVVKRENGPEQTLVLKFAKR